jgi:hypothetical protein
VDFFYSCRNFIVYEVLSQHRPDGFEVYAETRQYGHEDYIVIFINSGNIMSVFKNMRLNCPRFRVDNPVFPYSGFKVFLKLVKHFTEAVRGG